MRREWKYVHGVDQFYYGGPCRCCGKNYHTSRVSAWAMNSYCGGKCIQETFPDLSLADREFIISGICPTCWDDTFGEEN